MEYDEEKQGNYRGHISPVGRSLNMWHVAASVIHVEGVRSLISYCWVFFCSVHSNLLVQYTVLILSLATEVMCILASLGLWMICRMILE